MSGTRKHGPESPKTIVRQAVAATPQSTRLNRSRVGELLRAQQGVTLEPTKSYAVADLTTRVPAAGGATPRSLLREAIQALPSRNYTRTAKSATSTSAAPDTGAPVTSERVEEARRRSSILGAPLRTPSNMKITLRSATGPAEAEAELPKRHQQEEATSSSISSTFPVTPMPNRSDAASAATAETPNLTSRLNRGLLTQRFKDIENKTPRTLLRDVITAGPIRKQREDKAKPSPMPNVYEMKLRTAPPPTPVDPQAPSAAVAASSHKKTPSRKRATEEEVNGEQEYESSQDMFLSQERALTQAREQSQPPPVEAAPQESYQDMVKKLNQRQQQTKTQAKSKAAAAAPVPAPASPAASPRPSLFRDSPNVALRELVHVSSPFIGSAKKTGQNPAKSPLASPAAAVRASPRLLPSSQRKGVLNQPQVVPSGEDNEFNDTVAFVRSERIPTADNVSHHSPIMQRMSNSGDVPPSASGESFVARSAAESRKSLGGQSRRDALIEEELRQLENGDAIDRPLVDDDYLHASLDVSRGNLTEQVSTRMPILPTESPDRSLSRRDSLFNQSPVQPEMLSLSFGGTETFRAASRRSSVANKPQTPAKSPAKSPTQSPARPPKQASPPSPPPPQVDDTVDEDDDDEVGHLAEVEDLDAADGLQILRTLVPDASSKDKSSFMKGYKIRNDDEQRDLDSRLEETQAAVSRIRKLFSPGRRQNAGEDEEEEEIRLPFELPERFKKPSESKPAEQEQPKKQPFWMASRKRKRDQQTAAEEESGIDMGVIDDIVGQEIMLRPANPKRAKLSGQERVFSATKLTEQLFSSFLGPVSMPNKYDVFATLHAGVDSFWMQMSRDLSAYSKHAGRRIVNEHDLELLMKRQRKIREPEVPLSSLARQYFPPAFADRIIPTMRADAKISVKPWSKNM